MTPAPPPAAAGHPPLLRDVIDIKPSISTSDFVLKLAEAVADEGVAAALADYVVTERLLDNFDQALGLIKAALDGQTSKAAYLHGSFGSGKSHFMAVLHALLGGNPAARSRGEFDAILAKHTGWLDGEDGTGTRAGAGTNRKKFLLVPYHMLGAKSLEQRILGGYVSHVKKLHPEADTPQVYRTDALFEDVRRLRSKIGDEQFIAGLEGGGESGGDDEWGDSFAWTSAHLNTALAAEQLDGDEANLDLVNPTAPAELRAKLVHDAIQGWFPGFTQNAQEDEHGFISLDAGLAVIAAHAKSLNYAGLILFMDELILWLANRIHDQKFVSREADKITNFVEGADSRRAIPIVSFIARQRDLRELVGEELSGAGETAIQDSLKLASGRFDKITLEDRNLPEIAHARLLKPKPGREDTVAEAFAKAKRVVGPQVWDVLLGSDEGVTGADESAFRLTYPFSPAFMDTLVSISSALQRSRTGLKLMGQLLADHRDDARLEDLIPLGDLYQVIADGGDEPFVEKLKAEFKEADKLYKTKLRSFLLTDHQVTEEEVEKYLHRPGSITDPVRRGHCKDFVGDNRLICTLLLSALAPTVPALQDLTIRRLYALNHGSVTSPIPGAEVGMLKNKVDNWASHFAEIKATGSDANPGVRLELAGVDVDSVIANANVNNNPGNRRALLKQLLWEEIGADALGSMSGDSLPLLWRGSDRALEVVSGNIADRDDLPDHEFNPVEQNAWRLVVDLPFDEGEYGPVDDANRIRDLKALPGERPQTVAWIPTHLSTGRYQDFQRLVTINYALADEQRFTTQYASHLNPDNRASAKGMLESQREALVKTVKDALKQAYGLAAKKPADVVLGYDDHFIALPDVPDLTPRIGASLHDGIRDVAGKLLAHQYPAHPDFDPEGNGTLVRPADARAVFAHVREAVDKGEGGIEIPAKDRPLMRRLAAPLLLGTQKEAYFQLSRTWPEHFNRQARAEGVTGDLTVVRLTDWLDVPRRMGLDVFLANLVIASYAEMDDRVWVRSGSLLEPQPEAHTVKADYALRQQPAPDDADWDRARARFEEIFGEKPPTLKRSRLVGQFARQIVSAARRLQPHAADLVRELEKRSPLLGLDAGDGGAEAGRLALARRSLALLDTLLVAQQSASGGDKQVVTALAGFDLGPDSGRRHGASIVQAEAVAKALVSAQWPMLELAGTMGAEGAAILESLRGAARADQLTLSLPEALGTANRDIIELVKRREQAAAANRAQAPKAPAAPEAPAGPGAVDLSTSTSQPPVPEAPAPRQPQTTGGTTPRAGRRSGGGTTTAARAVAELSAELAALAEAEPDAAVEITWRVVE